MNVLKPPVNPSSIDRAISIPVTRISPQRIPENTSRSSQEVGQVRSADQIKEGRPTEVQGYQRLVEQMNQMAQFLNRNYRFRIDETTSQLVVQVTDTKTGELIQQLPPEELLRLASQMNEMLGMFVDEVA